MLGLVEKVAADKKIAVQWRALSRSTGTDTDSFAYSNDGCPSVLISIPLRYMHTTVEMLHRDDIENTIHLMYETLLTLTPKTNLNYLWLQRPAKTRNSHGLLVVCFSVLVGLRYRPILSHNSRIPKYLFNTIFNPNW